MRKYYTGKLYSGEFLGELLRTADIYAMSLFDIWTLLDDTVYFVIEGKIELIMLAKSGKEGSSESLHRFEKGGIFNTATLAGKDTSKDRLRIIADADTEMVTFSLQQILKVNKMLKYREVQYVHDILTRLFPAISSDLLTVLEGCRMSVFALKDVIYRYGDKTSCFYMLISGEIEVLEPMDERLNPKLQLLYTLIPPALFGDEHLRDDAVARRPHLARCKSEVICFTFFHSDISSFSKHSLMLNAFLKHISV